jgi:hypothetical protein
MKKMQLREITANFRNMLCITKADYGGTRRTSRTILLQSLDDMGAPKELKHYETSMFASRRFIRRIQNEGIWMTWKTSGKSGLLRSTQRDASATQGKQQSQDESFSTFGSKYRMFPLE